MQQSYHLSASMQPRKKTIVYTIDTFIYGGVTTFVKQYVAMAEALGYGTVIVGFRGDMTNLKKHFPTSTIIEIPYDAHYNSFFGRILDGIRYRKALRDLYARVSIDIVHTATTWSTLYTASVIRSWRARRIMTVYGLYHEEFKSLYPDKITIGHRAKAVVLKLLQRIAFQFPQRMIAISSYADDLVVTEFGERYKAAAIIPGTIGTLPKKIPTVLHMPLTMVWIGRAEPRKGLAQLLEALAHTNTSYKTLRALIASPVSFYFSSGIMETYEQTNVGLQVQFVHKAEAAIQEQLYREADVFVMPSQGLETFGMTILESLARGIPVIGTPVGAIPETLQHIDRHLLARDATPKGIRAAFQWFMKLSLKQRKELSERARSYVAAHHLTARWTAALGTVYESC